MAGSSTTEEKIGETEMGDVENSALDTTLSIPKEERALDFEERKDLKQGLLQRHIQMIALAGTIGTGLFLGSGRAIATGGPGGALIGWTVIGLLVSSVCLCVAEMAALVPLSGAIIRHAEYFFDPALSFAQGWNTIYAGAVGLPAEMAAVAVIMQFWVNVNNGVWITVFGIFVFLTSLYLVRLYGEIEFGFAMLKIILIVGVILMGIVLSAGGGPNGERIGFKYWNDPGAFTQFLNIPGPLGRFLGFWTTFTSAAYAYNGVDSIPTAASETVNPRRNIPKAAKRIFVRVLVFYMLSIFILTINVSAADPALLQSTGTAAQSPFVIAATNAGVKVVPHIINAVVLTSAWSAANSGMLTTTRALYGLAREGHAPKIFMRVNRWGIPWVAVCFMASFMALGYMSTGNTSAATAFSWLQDLVAISAFTHWIIVFLVYLRFYYGCKAQGIDRNELPWKSPLQPYMTWVGLTAFTIILLTNGYTVFIKGHWSTETFIASYINIPIVLILYFGYKVVKKTKLVPYEDMPIRHFLQIAKDHPEPPEKPLKGWNVLTILWN